MTEPGGFTVVTSKSTERKEKEAAGTDAVFTFFTSDPWKAADTVVLRESIGQVSKIGSRLSVKAHVSINQVDLAAVQKKGLATARGTVDYHVTLEFGDDYKDKYNPRWYSNGGGWQVRDDEDTRADLNGATGALKKELDTILAVAKKAVRG
jgi:hypothetical protein